MIVVRALDPEEAERRRDELIDVLCDVVEGGASIGFLLPLGRAKAEAYWASVFAAMTEGRRQLVAAFWRDHLIGSVQLDWSRGPMADTGLRS